MTALRALTRCTRGTTAAEFGLVSMLLMVLLFGVIDAGRYMYDVNRAQKAVQAGARFAVVTDIVASGLQDYTFVSATNPPGTPVGDGQFGSILCNAPGGTVTCACVANPCSDEMVGDADTAAFSAIAQRMRHFYGELTDDELSILYEGVGLGYAGNPHGSDVSPMVTVQIAGATFAPATIAVFSDNPVSLPSFRSTMTLEDGLGTVSN